MRQVVFLFLYCTSIAGQGIGVVKNFIEDKNGKFLDEVVINLHKAESLQIGQQLDTFRSHNGYINSTGRITIIKNFGENHFLGRIDAASKLLFEKMMVGDQVRSVAYRMYKKKGVATQFSLSFDDIFSFPGKGSENFEISLQGQQKLAKELKNIESKPFERLLIKVHTGHRGFWKENQSESEQRALAIKTWLVSEGYAMDRIVAVGMGESEIKDASFVPGYLSTNRRVEIKPLY